MTEMAVREDNLPAVVTDLTVWAQNAHQASLVAVSLARTPFVPASLRDRDDNVTIGNITAAILTGAELGMQPMAALRSMDVIQGTPALRAITLRALVQGRGHDVWVEETTATRAIVCGQRKGSTKVQSSTWTLDRARGLNLLGKDNWKKQPAAMLVARATSELCRYVAADVIMAMPYSIEEIEDGTVDDSPAGPAPTPAKRTAQRRTAPPAAQVRPEVPAAESEPPPEPDFDEPTTVEVGITQPQMRKLQATLGDYGIDAREDRLRLVSAIVGREVSTSSELSKDEASALIDTLEQMSAEAARTLAAAASVADSDGGMWPEPVEIPQ